MASSRRPRPLRPEDALIPVRDLAERQILIITYNRITDTVEIDEAGLSPIEVRGILSLAVQQVTEVIDYE